MPAIGRLVFRSIKKFSINASTPALTSCSTGEILTPDGDVLWRKHFKYSQSQVGRAKELNELEADGGKLMKEEMDFAAKTTAQNFIDHIAGKDLS